MKIYVRSATRVKPINIPEDKNITGMIIKDFGIVENDPESQQLQFLGTYVDYKGRKAYKYKLTSPDYPDDIEWVVPTERGYYDMCDDFDNIASRWGDVDDIVLPRMPKTAPANGWPPCRTIKVKDSYGDTQEFQSIRSRDGAIKFLYGQLANTDFPMMSPMRYQGDAEYYKELMLDFENEPKDEDSHTYFTTNDGTTYCIDSEIDLKKAIEIYYAIPNVESILHGDADNSVIFNGCIWRDDEGYWYDGDRESTFEAGEAKYGKGNYLEI